MVKSTLNKEANCFNWSSGNNLHLTLLFIGLENSFVTDMSDWPNHLFIDKRIVENSGENSPQGMIHRS